MKKCKITVMKCTEYPDLMEIYLKATEHKCPHKVGDVFIANGWEKPEGVCDSAWESISPYIRVLAHGGEDFFSGWMKDKKSAMISCADGFRPVSFYLEALDEDAE